MVYFLICKQQPAAVDFYIYKATVQSRSVIRRSWLSAYICIAIHVN